MGWKKLQRKNLNRLIYWPAKVERAAKNFFNSSAAFRARKNGGNQLSGRESFAKIRPASSSVSFEPMSNHRPGTRQV